MIDRHDAILSALKVSDDRLRRIMHPPRDPGARQPSPPSRLPITREIADILHWLQKRWAPVGALSLALPVIYTHHYAIERNIPLDVLSGEMITTYPAMLAVLLYAAMLLVAFALLPALVLLTPIDDMQRRLIDPMTSTKESHPTRRRLAFLWITSQLVYTAWLWLSALALSHESIAQHAHLSAILSVLALLLCIGASIWILLLARPSRDSPIPFDFWMLTAGGALLQALISTFIILHSIEISPSEPKLGWVVVISLLISGLLVTSQLAAAKFFARWNRVQRPFTTACVSAVVLMGLVALIPPAAARLAGYALSIPASGGNRHVRLEWTAESTPQPSSATCLHILATTGEHYIVRHRADSKDVTFIPRANVTGLTHCSPPASSTAGEAPTTQNPPSPPPEGAARIGTSPPVPACC